MAKIMEGTRDARDLPDSKVHALTSDEVKASREPLGKCINPATGEPVSARREECAVSPVAGSVRPSSDGHGVGACPHCGAGSVSLSKKGYLTAHTVRRGPVPAPAPKVRLAERQVETTDTGARIGSPDAAMRTRTAELGAAAGTVSVKIKVKGANGKTEIQEVPPTPDNIRTAMRQESAKKQRQVKIDGKPQFRTDPQTGAQVPVMGGGPDRNLLARLGSMLKGVTGLAAMPVLGAEPGTYKVYEAVTLDAPNAPEGREERAQDGRNGHVPTSPGAALVNGGTMSGKVPSDRARVTKGGKSRNAIGWSAPVGRPRPDRVVVKGNADACKGKGCKVADCVAIVGGRDGYLQCHAFRELSKNQARRYWQHVATAKKRREAAQVLSAREVVTERRIAVTRQTMGGPAIR